MFGTKCIATGDFLVLIIESSRTVKSCNVKNAHFSQNNSKEVACKLSACLSAVKQQNVQFGRTMTFSEKIQYL